jgi:glycerophosphoryl diester phosphodiesterase
LIGVTGELGRISLQYALVALPRPTTQADLGRKPEVVAHRGASALAPEHTLAAYESAIELGADALECDVRLTVDGHLVCVHDPRIDRTSDAKGRVSNKTLDDLRGYDFGAWWLEHKGSQGGLTNDDFPQYDAESGGILTLDRLLELVVDSGVPIKLAIETKHPTRYGGYTERVLAQTLERFGVVSASPAESRVRVMSFSSIAMRRMRDLAPTVPAVYLLDKLPIRMRSGRLPTGADTAGPSIELVTEYPEVVARWRRNGYGVHVWTVDDPQQLAKAQELAVDAVITNVPGEIIKLLSAEADTSP